MTTNRPALHTGRAAVWQRSRALVQRPETQFIGGAIGLVSGVFGIYQVIGLRASLVAGSGVLVFYIYQGFRWLRRLREVEQQLLTELPHQHGFLVEFLKQTYKLRGDDGIARHNRGLTINCYDNNFIVRDTDCANSQLIRGSNTGTEAIRGVSFALVGGSSIASAELGSTYSLGDGLTRTPLFLVDEDRFKVVLNEFLIPLAPGDSFALEYQDEWTGSMRIKGDGFFFPESLYFPDGLHRLTSHIQFSFSIASVAVLDVDIDNGIVRPCQTQPIAVTPTAGMVAAFQWLLDAPQSSHVYVLYYRAA